MKRLILIIAFLLIPTASVAAGDVPPHPGQTNVIALSDVTHAKPSTVRSTRMLPGGDAKVYVDARFNGHRAEIVYANSRFQVTYVWHGVIVLAHTYRHVGPAMLNIGTARVGGKPVHVRVTFSWED